MSANYESNAVSYVTKKLNKANLPEVQSSNDHFAVYVAISQLPERIKNMRKAKRSELLDNPLPALQKGTISLPSICHSTYGFPNFYLHWMKMFV